MRFVRLKQVVRNVVEKNDGRPRPFVGLEDIGSGSGALLTTDPAMKPAEDSLVHKPGDVLFSKLRPYLAKSLLATAEGTATGELLVFRPNTEIDSRFLLYLTLSAPWLEWANTTSYGTKMPRTSWELMGDFRFWLPPTDEQRRIADFLDAETAKVQTLIAAMRQQLDILNERRLSLLHDTFEIREGMTTVRLGYMSALVTSGPRGWGEYVGDNGRLFFRSANLNRSSIRPNLREIARVDPPEGAAPEAERSRVRRGDVLVGITGANTGWVALADDSVEGASVSQHVCMIRPSSQLDSTWLAYLMCSPLVQEGLLGAQYGGTKTQLSLPDIRNVRVPVVDVAKQECTAQLLTSRIDAMEEQRAVRLRQIELLTERKQALITAAVTGQFDVTTGRGVDVS